MKMRNNLVMKLSLLTVLLFFQYEPCIGQWTTQESGITDNLLDVFFIDEHNGWAAGENGIIIATTDGGSTWTVQETPVDKNLTRILFTSADTGYVISDSTDLLFTKNGGASWLTYDFGTGIQLRGISFINSDTGWVSGTDYILVDRSIAVLFKTVDGGYTWERVYEIPVPLGLPNFFNGVSFVDQNNGLAFETYYFDNFNQTYVHRTTDGGGMWEKIGETNGPTYKVKRAAGDTLWATGMANISISFNSGANWTGIGRSFAFGGVPDIELVNGRTGWFITNNTNFIENSRINYTEDAGTTYNIMLEKQKPYLRGLSAIGSNLLWAVGDSGLVIHYDKTITSVKEKPQIPREFELHQNYPNPFNLSTVIRFNTIQQARITIRIYDIAGREIVILTSKVYLPGTHEVTWDGRNEKHSIVSSGMYFYQLKSGNYRTVKKMILLK
ncbi:YCF48-related protein [candidate division KSB1 bacterium]